MLQIKNLKKQYRTGDFVQKALDGVSLNLRDNEFVAILGPSGSGKTTFLNVIGGLDRYDSGDIIINGVSTKKYKDRDWDAYRNHTIGFVFQSYNLIMHQSVLSNVELALTISGISGAERRRRAEEALREVGLGDHIHKKPNQLSGGQMQRVAIARALVNDPDIVLADEPTGALDSETSVQVMELLKKVAEDRLVVMVTHNPDLAYQYATRIVNIKDGQIVSDSDPYEIEEKDQKEPVHKRIGKASMSFFTALQLSFNNLRSKKARTILVAFAGSIGIIGIAMILSLSNGVNKYIEDQESEALSNYPVQIQKTGFNLSSLLNGGADGSSTGSSGSSGSSTSKKKKKNSDTIQVQNMTENLMTQVQSNDLKSLKKYLESGSTDIEKHVDGIEYQYNVTPQIYRVTTDNGSETVSQVNPNTVYSSLNLGSSQMSTMMGTAMNTDIFTMLPENKKLYQDQYDLKAGHWPKNKNELVLVLSQDGSISDSILYTLGLRSVDELQEKINSSGESSTETTTAVTSGSRKNSGKDKDSYTYRDFLGMDFRMIYPSDLYSYDSTYQVWTSKADDQNYVKSLAEKGEKLTITGIVQQKEETSSSMLSSGIAYPASLVKDIMSHAADSDVVKAQKKTPEINVLSGQSFDAEADTNNLDLTKLFTIDTDAFQKAFQVGDFSSLSSAFSGMKLDLSGIDFSSLMNSSSGGVSPESLQGLDLSSLMNGVTITASQEELQSMFSDLMNGYLAYAAQDPKTNYSVLGDAVLTYLQSDSAKAILTQEIQKLMQKNQSQMISTDEVIGLLDDVLPKMIQGYTTYCQDSSRNWSPVPMDENGQTNESKLSEQVQQYLSDPSAKAALNQALSGSESYQEIQKKIAGIQISGDDVSSLVTALLNGYNTYAKEKGDQPDLTLLTSSFTSYLKSDAGQQAVTSIIQKSVNTDQLEKNLESAFRSAFGSAASSMAGQMQSVMNAVEQQIAKSIQTSMESAMKGLSGNLSSLFSVDPTALAGAIQMNMSPEEIQELLTSLVSGAGATSYDNNLAKFGYGDPDDPTEIDIYPKDFSEKDQVVSILDNYNKKMRSAGDTAKVISYTDTVGTLMSSVTRIVNTVTTVLIGFVAISLVVSSIMIGVITYISVLERRKEIGILRAIGASKRNIRDVFNAETFITGLLAGIMGVGITAILLIPANLVVIPKILPDVTVHVSLPIVNAVELIALSVVLTLIAGLLPASKASRSDPVTALRAE